MPLSASPADRAIYAATARLEKSLAAHRALAACVAGRLPIPAAEAHMDDIETHLDAIRARLADAHAIHEAAIEQLAREAV